jgi:hypothetical protein
MGASGWSYFVPYQPDINKALQELRQKVFQEGDYFKPAEWQKRLYEHKIISEQELNNALDERSSGVSRRWPQTAVGSWSSLPTGGIHAC